MKLSFLIYQIIFPTSIEGVEHEKDREVKGKRRKERNGRKEGLVKKKGGKCEDKTALR